MYVYLLTLNTPVYYYLIYLLINQFISINYVLVYGNLCRNCHFFRLVIDLSNIIIHPTSTEF